LNTTRFMGVEIELSTDVLAPREETEILGRAAIDILRKRQGTQHVIDMCCGSGNLACAVASAVEHVAVWACDLTESCVALARRNVERLGLSEKVQIHQGDLFAPLSLAELGEQIDLVMCNPPYISTSRLEGEKSYLLRSEPREAFDGGPYGLSLHQRVIGDALRYLRPGGWIALEFGQGQERQLTALFKRAGGYRNQEYLLDAQGAPRVAMAQKIG
jgi:release factor glutamine methyltransferase